MLERERVQSPYFRFSLHSVLSLWRVLTGQSTEELLLSTFFLFATATQELAGQA